MVDQAQEAEPLRVGQLAHSLFFLLVICRHFRLQVIQPFWSKKKNRVCALFLFREPAYVEELGLHAGPPARKIEAEEINVEIVSHLFQNLPETYLSLQHDKKSTYSFFFWSR